MSSENEDLTAMEDLLHFVRDAVDLLFNGQVEDSTRRLTAPLPRSLTKKHAHAEKLLASRRAFHAAQVTALRALLSEAEADYADAIRVLSQANQLAQDFINKHGHLVNRSSPSWVRQSVDTVRSLFMETREQESDTALPFGLSGAQLCAWVLDCRIVVAGTLGWLAAVLFRQGSYLSAALKVRGAWLYTQELLKDVSPTLVDSPERKSTETQSSASQDDNKVPALCISSQADVMLGAGAFHFFVSLVPRSFRRLAEAIGFKGDRSRGWRELHLCVEHNAPSSGLARCLLLWIESAFYEDYVGAEARYTAAIRDYPNGALFHFLGGYVARKGGHVSDACRRFEMAQKCAQAATMDSVRHICSFELGDCHFLECRFDKAQRHLNDFMVSQRAASGTFHTRAAYESGVCLEMLGRHEEALEVMKTVPSFARRFFSFDQYCRRMADAFVREGGISHLKAIFLCTSNLLACQSFQRAAKELNAAARIPEVKLLLSQMCPESKVANCCMDKEHKAVSPIRKRASAPSYEATSNDVVVYLYLRARTLRGLKELSKAVHCLEVVVANDVHADVDRHVIPHAMAELGEIALERRELDAAEELFKNASAFPGPYDFEKPLGRRLQLNTDLIAALRARRDPSGDNERDISLDQLFTRLM